MAWTYTLDGLGYHLNSGAVIPALGLGTGGGMSRLDTRAAVLHALHVFGLPFFTDQHIRRRNVGYFTE
jgi:hypothetical protein